MSETNQKVVSEETRIKQRIASAKIYARNKANAFPCPECGQTINKSIAIRHYKSTAHKYGALLKQTSNANAPPSGMTT